MTKPSRKEENLQKRKIWKQRIHEWEKEGINQSEYCHRHNLKEHQFSYWKKRLMHAPAPAVSFFEVQIDSQLQNATSSIETGLKLIVDDRCHIAIERDFDVITFQRIIKALG